MAGGRPSVYDTKVKPFLREIKILRENGTSVEDIAKLLKVSRKTVYNHINEVDELLHTFKSANEKLVEDLEATLYDSAMGRVKKTKTVLRYDRDNELYFKEIYEETLAPNIAALIFSLTNLKPDKWSNKQEVNIESNDDIAPSFGKVVKDEYESSN